MMHRIRFAYGICILIMICCGLAGCGKREPETVQEEIFSYVYLPGRLATSPEGSCGLPEGFGRPIVGEGCLYFLQGNQNVQSVGRASLSDEDETVGLAEAESLFVISTSGMELGKDEGYAPSEDEILAFFEYAMEEGREKANQPPGQAARMDPKKTYISFLLKDYAVDQEGNLYLAVECSTGGYFQMNSLGCLACRRTAEGEWTYRSFMLGMELAQEGFAVDGSGGVYILTQEGITALDWTGQKTAMVRTDRYKGELFSGEKLFGDTEGHVYYFVYEDSGFMWKGMRIESSEGLSLQDAEGLSGSSRMQGCSVDRGKVSWSTTDTFYEYSAESGSAQSLLLWGNSNLIYSDVRGSVILDNEKILVWYEEEGQEGLYLLVRTPVDELPEREPVVLAAFDPDLSLKDAAVRFNRQNGKYQVFIETYGYAPGDAEGAAGRRDAALVSSDPPDLVSLDGLDLKKSMEKGLLEDLGSYLEQSAVLDREDFLENALEGYTVGGKLVGIPAEIRVKALAGRLSQVRELESWTMEDVYAIAEQYPEQTKLLSDGFYRSDGNADEISTRTYLLEKFCSAWYLEEYVDWDKGTCSFDSEGFRRLLQWAGEYGRDETPNAGAGESVYYTRGYMPEDALLMEDFLDFERTAVWQVQFGEEIRLLGYPTADGRGTVSVQPISLLGIAANAGNREGAWAFLEYYISLVCGQKDILTANKAQLRELTEEWTQEEGDTERKAFVMLDQVSVPVYGISREMAQQVMNLLQEADFSPDGRLEDNIVSIVLEEAGSYYNGSKSLEDVTEIIQNRVSTLVQEQR